tara:strand:- start:405 stop:821 length:417 start_codon:yes stop_codon:yes gene_type:complete
MIEKFNGIIYLLIFVIHFLVYAVYAFRTIVGTKSFMDQYNIDHSAAVMIRFFGAPFVGSVIMALYILFVRDGGVNGTWGFFNLIFVQNLMYFLVGVYTIYINKLGHNEKTNSEGVIASGALTILSAVLCYGLADKIYI